MTARHRQIRALLYEMARDRCYMYIKAFNLPPDEESALLGREYYHKSYPQICEELGMSAETLKRTRRRAFARIADLLDHV